MADAPSNEAPYRLIQDVEFGDGVVVHGFTNLYGCEIGADSRIGTFVEIQAGASIGSRCKVQSHTFICEGVEIGDEVFVGHGVVFVNDRHPRATATDGLFQSDEEWTLERIVIEDRAAIGSGAVIVGSVRIGRGALVGAGAVVTRDVPAESVVSGVPARVVRSARPDLHLVATVAEGDQSEGERS